MRYYAIASGQWENKVGPASWHAVSSEADGIVAYFSRWGDALLFADTMNGLSPSVEV